MITPVPTLGMLSVPADGTFKGSFHRFRFLRDCGGEGVENEKSVVFVLHLVSEDFEIIIFLKELSGLTD